MHIWLEKEDGEGPPVLPLVEVKLCVDLATSRATVARPPMEIGGRDGTVEIGDRGSEVEVGISLSSSSSSSMDGVRSGAIWESPDGESSDIFPSLDLTTSTDYLAAVDDGIPEVADYLAAVDDDG
uniref:Uncharacterized protein n=2 Tax=Oryza sativa subsp. japonica TaxID=39947 RepID=Q10I25_ORYSJ|nr:hypothetical protein LOC_Os03g36944 [Oryza sativa Japonica Group]